MIHKISKNNFLYHEWDCHPGIEWVLHDYSKELIEIPIFDFIYR